MPAGQRTRIRHKDVRLILPQNPGVGTDEDQYARGRYFEADCLSSDPIGAFVYVTGPAVLSYPQVTTVDIKVSGKWPAVGMIIEKSSTTRCLVIVFGEIAVSPAVLTPGQNYWIGTTGLIVATPPVAGVGEKVATLIAGYAIDTGRLLISPDRRPIVRVG